MPRRKNLYYRNSALLIIFIIALIYCVRYLICFRFGIFYEEGRDANAYLWVLQGNLPYRDFEWIYGPFSFLIYPLIMKVFGVSLIVLRLSYIIFASLVIPLAYFLARRIMPHFWAGIAAFLSVVLWRVPFYTYNHVFAVLGELGCLLMICRFMESDKRISHLFWAGTFAAITILTKPILAGVSLFASISLFLLFFANPNPLKKRLKDYSMFAIATVPLILLYVLYFYSQTKLKNIPVTYPYLGWDSIISIEDIDRVSLSIFPLSFKRLIGILPMQRIIGVTSFTDLKEFFPESFSNFIFALPFIAAAIIFLIYTVSKFSKATPEIKDKIFKDRDFLSLFIVFSILISMEAVFNPIPSGSKAYTIQVPFILSVYILYFIKKAYSRNRPIILNIFIALFLFYLSFLDFFYYSYAVIKKYKYVKPLNLERAKGVLVTGEEKELYDLLSSYLAFNLHKDGKIAVIGYYPQISFLIKQENIFEKSQYIFSKTGVILLKLKAPNNKEKTKILLGLLENKIISKIEEERPKIILDVINDDSLGDFQYISSKIKYYIEENYFLDKVFTPADIRGVGGCPSCQLIAYKYKKEKR